MKVSIRKAVVQNDVDFCWSMNGLVKEDSFVALDVTVDDELLDCFVEGLFSGLFLVILEIEHPRI